MDVYKSVAISSGHGKIVRGAAGIIDEVDEARRLVDALVSELTARGVTAIAFHDDISKTQSENLNRITDWHNDCVRDLDISTHFNAYEQVDKPMGTEVLYVTQSKLAGELSAAVAKAGGFLNRGAKKRTDLHFLNQTDEPSILLEVCFVDSEADCELYEKNFDKICDAIAGVIGGNEETLPGEPPPVIMAGEDNTIGKVSWFGGPDDTGVSPNEGLAFIYKMSDAPYLFLPYQPEGTTGLARRLNPEVHFIAMRFDYDVIPKEEMVGLKALVRNPKTGVALAAWCADWGPHEDTDRVADISKSLMTDLGLKTDDTVEVIFPWYGEDE